MARKESASLIEQHVEKIVLAVAVVVLLLAVMYWGLSSPRTISLDTGGGIVLRESCAPSQVDQALREAAEQLERKMAAGDDVDPIPVPDYPKRLAGIFDNPYGPESVPDYVILNSGREPIKGQEPPDTLETVRLADLLPLQAPEQPMVKFSREMQVIPKQSPADGSTGGQFGFEGRRRSGYRRTEEAGFEYNEVDVVHGIAVFEFGKMREKWKEALAKSKLPAEIIFAAVETQRRHLLSNGTWSEPEPVSLLIVPGIPQPPAIPVLDEKNFPEVSRAIRELARIENQEYVLQPPYCDIVWPNNQVGPWYIRNHKPITRVSSLLEKPEPTLKPKPGGTLADVRRPRPASGRRRDATRMSERERGGRRSRRGSQRDRRSRGRSGRERERERRRPAAREREGGFERERETRREPLMTERERGAGAAPAMFERERGMSPGRRSAGRQRSRSGRDAQIDQAMLVLIPSLWELLNNPAGILEAWFHDANVQEGMIYSYRLRLRVINPLLGRLREAADIRDTNIQTLATGWSDWSEPVEVRRPAEFFLVGHDRQKESIVVDVFTQKWGQRLRHRFSVGPGEPIGGSVSQEVVHLTGAARERQNIVVSFDTGAIAVDFNFKKRQRIPGTSIFRKTTELLYLDPNGRLCARTEFADNASKRYKELVAEVEQVSEPSDSEARGY